MSSHKGATQWDTYHARAKLLEARLEKKVQNYSSIAQRINADFLCDEENPLIEDADEQQLAGEIERDLTELNDCIQVMRQQHHLSNHQEVMVKRYHEIHFDYSTEFKSTSSTVQRKRESMELFHSSKNLHQDDQDSSVAKLLRERSSIAASMRSINDVISQAFETKSSLMGQRSTIMGSTSGLTNLGSNVPSFGRLIDNIQRKKSLESYIVAIVVAILLCFTVWWVFLR
jgi:Golgi SNAP receptor complex protein 1